MKKIVRMVVDAHPGWPWLSPLAAIYGAAIAMFLLVLLGLLFSVWVGLSNGVGIVAGLLLALPFIGVFLLGCTLLWQTAMREVFGIEDDTSGAPWLRSALCRLYGIQ